LVAGTEFLLKIMVSLQIALIIQFSAFLFKYQMPPTDETTSNVK
jgi:hypothetical protein